MELDIVLPVHNEGDSIEATLREWYEELAPKISINFVVCEDGSTDNTKEVLLESSRTLPMRLITAADRKGASRAVLDGLKMTTAPYILGVDGDGQCDPRDTWQFWELRQRYDVIIGHRAKRADTLVRKTMSSAFRVWYSMLFPVPIHDPSCPYVLIQRRVLDRLKPELGVLRQGAWLEFTARAYRRGFDISELPIHHRQRRSGSTRVFKWRKIPAIAVGEGLGLLKIWLETR